MASLGVYSSFGGFFEVPWPLKLKETLFPGLESSVVHSKNIWSTSSFVERRIVTDSCPMASPAGQSTAAASIPPLSGAGSETACPLPCVATAARLRSLAKSRGRFYGQGSLRLATTCPSRS